MIIDYLQYTNSIFVEVPQWGHPTITGYRLGAADPALHSIKYRGGKIDQYYVPIIGAGDKFEATSHELAHIVDFILRGKMERVFKQNYGNLSFDKKLKNVKAAFRNELRVLSIQLHIMQMAEAQVDLTTLSDMIADLYGLDLFARVKYGNGIEIATQFYNSIDKDSIQKTIDQFLNEVDKRCLKIHRRKKT